MLERHIRLLVGDALSGAVNSAATWLATLSVDPSWLMPAAIHSRSAWCWMSCTALQVDRPGVNRDTVVNVEKACFNIRQGSNVCHDVVKAIFATFPE
jgi:hypothetical protein